MIYDNISLYDPFLFINLTMKLKGIETSWLPFN